MLISLILNVVLYNASTLYYRELNQVRLNPLDLDAYAVATVPHSVATKRIRVLFLGDSRAYQWPAPVINERFEFFNRGIGAQTTAQVLLRFDEHVAPLHPNVVIVQIGINDLKAVPLFPAQKRQIIGNCENNIASVVAQARQLGATVILTTIFPTGDVPVARRLVWSSEIEQAVVEVNAYIHSLAGPNVVIFDSAQLLADSNGKTQKSYQVDTLHINQIGYAMLNQQLAALLTKVVH